MKYRDFKDQCWADGIELPLSDAKITFYVKMPRSWSKKKKEQANLQPHQQTPDLDNFVKALFDAVYDDDSLIWSFYAKKLWAYEGSIEII